MTQEQIIEGNKTIAEFMGTKEDETRYFHESSEYFFEACELEYHFSWDWLMPVVEKIEDIENESGGNSFQVAIYEDEVKIYDRRTTPWSEVVNIPANGEGKKANAYKAVVEFIKWYNESKNK